MNRPSYRELNKKIKKARKAVLTNRISMVNPASIAADALELGYLVKDVLDVLADILKEITPREYAGQYPPQRAYESDILDTELLAFRWESKRLGGKIYLKFAIKEDRMWLVSLHQDRQGTGAE
ncbi:MAG: hypothetical protein KAV83_00790 [Desulfobacterales bacterium]|nr:hypothetical protein [Desulfobacterales bacterium]